MALTPLVGRKTALVAFSFLYLLVWGRFNFIRSALYAASVLAMLYLVYDKLLRIIWVRP